MKKILLIVSAVIVAIILVAVFVVKQQSGYTKVLTAKIHKQDLATVVSGTGQVKPKTYVNVGATSFGRITHPYGEGRRPRKEGSGDRHRLLRMCSQRRTFRLRKPPSPPPKRISPLISPPKEPPTLTSHTPRPTLSKNKLDWDRAQKPL